MRLNSRSPFWILFAHFCSAVVAGTIGETEAAAAASAKPTATASSTSNTSSDNAAPTPTPTPKHLNAVVPPLGLRWGETKEELAMRMQQAGARIVTRSKVDDKDAWTIEGIDQPALRQTIAYFDERKTLVEVELQYGDSQWTIDAYKAFVASVTARLESYYGDPEVLERDRRPNGKGVETIAGYRWQTDTKGVLLFFYSLEQGKNAYVTVSLHYMAGLPPPEAPPEPQPSSTPETSPTPK
jgi:hypothetical protein